MMISTLFLAALAAAAPASILESRQMPSCASGVYIISARGTFEPQGFGLQEIAVNAILNKIPGSNASAVVYPASPVDIDGSLTTGVANAQQQITDYRNACPESKIVLTGYSQGAQVIGDAIAGGGTGEPDGTDSPAATPISQTIGSNVIAVILFGDPNRVKGQGVDSEAETCTISATSPRAGANHDAMQFYADKIDEYCASGDLVCCATGDNFLAHVSYFTDENAAAIATFVSSKFSA